MNKILKLFDTKVVIELFEKNVLPLYPEFEKIKSIKINTYKKGIWGKKYYHVVLEFDTVFITKDGKRKKLPIFCSAHHSEPRENVHDVLNFLWEKSFSKGHLTVPHPLFYSKYYKAVFYRGLSGHTLYHYIKRNDREKINEMLPKVAAWFVKLHSLDTWGARNFNRQNSRIKTVLPGSKNILHRLSYQYPKYIYIYEAAYDYFIKSENKYLNNKKNKKCLIHGDAHPDNVIKIGKRKVGAIDFADMSISDPARDIGSFLQQLDYMGKRKIGDKVYVNKMKKTFLNSYLKTAKIKMSDSLKKRIEMYYNWTTLRTATHHLLHDQPKPERANILIKEVKRKLKITKK